MYRSSTGSCLHSQVTELQNNEFSNQKDAIESFSKLYSVTAEQIAVSIVRMGTVMLLNSYFHYLYSKSILDATHKELKEIRASPERYQNWPSRIPKPDFDSILRAIDFLTPKL